MIGRIPSGSLVSAGSHDGGYSDPTLNEVIYRDSLWEALKKADKEIADNTRIIRNTLRTIKDPTVRAIYRNRLVYKMSWKEVAEAVNMDEAAAKMRFYRYRDKEKSKTE